MRPKSLSPPTAVGIAITLMLATTLIWHQAFNALMNLLLISGFVVGFLSLRRFGNNPWPSSWRWLLLAYSAYFGSAVVTLALQAGISDYDWSKLADYRYALVMLLLFPLLRFARPSTGYFWWGLVLCSIGSGIYAIAEVMAQGLEHRAGGTEGKAILFGDIAMATAVMSLPAMVYFKRYRSAIQYVPLLAFILGCVAVTLSGTRGAYLFFPVGVLILAMLYRKNISMRQLTTYGVLAFLLSAVLITQTSIPQRMQAAINEVEMYFIAPSEDTGSTSIGQRFHMWSVALESFEQAPIWGMGLGQMPVQFIKAYEAGKIPRIIAHRPNNSDRPHTHAHNEYLNTLATRGMLGGLALTALLLVPLMVFLRTRKDSTTESKALAMSGILCVSAFMYFGLTESVFFHPFTFKFYLLVTILITAFIHLESSKNNGPQA